MAYIPVVRLCLDFTSRLDREAFAYSVQSYLAARLAGLPVAWRAPLLTYLVA
jgi:hypothetical protein